MLRLLGIMMSETAIVYTPVFYEIQWTSNSFCGLNSQCMCESQKKKKKKN